jgi:hypothetical protein
MTDRRHESRGQDAEMATDLEALRRESARNLPSIESIVRTATRRPRTWEEYLMATFGFLRRRPWVSTALAGALAAIALLVVPFSYERITGQKIALTLSSPNLDAARIRQIAGQFKDVTHANGVIVEANAMNGATRYVLSSTIPGRSAAAMSARALAAELSKRGYDASVEVTPVRERVMGSMVAYAMDRVIQISVDDKSAAALESEIRQRLTEAGIPNASVSVEDVPGGQKVKIEATRQNVGEPGTGNEEPMPELQLTKGGVPLDQHGFTVRAEKRKSPDGTTLTLRVQDEGKSATIEVPHAETLSDAALASQVENQLRAAGIEATVTATNGKVEIHKP